jgi:hypothetical protein
MAKPVAKDEKRVATIKKVTHAAAEKTATPRPPE